MDDQMLDPLDALEQIKRLALDMQPHETPKGLRKIFGLCIAALEGTPAAAVPEPWPHVTNEWADMAISGLQWVRNINEGISTPAAALANLESSLVHCRAVTDNDRPILNIAPPATSRDRWMFEQGRLAERDPRTRAVEARQSEQDKEYAQLYRWLRSRNWDDSKLFVVSGRNSSVKLGTYCPSGDLLDAAIREAMADATKELKP